MKTIFISLFSNIVFGNFKLPNGVLDQLVKYKPKDTRIVFLTGLGFKDSLAPYLKGDEIKLEFIERLAPSGLAQKLFQFFYSYLIFTDTTRILATFGARTDIPPAGGNRHLAFIKKFIASTFGKSYFVKTKFIPWAFNKVFNKRPYRAIFEKYNPSLVFLPNIAFFPDLEILSEAKKLSIPTIAMACNWDHLNKYFIPLRADQIIVQNEPMRHEAVKLQGYKFEKTIPIGFPQFDIFFRYKDYILPRREFENKFNIPKDSKLIVFISGASYTLDEPDILETISRWIKENKLKSEKSHLFVRPYVVLRDRKNEEEKYKKLLNDSNVSFNWFRGDESLENKRLYLSMLYYSDVVISIFSTMAIEAAIFNKPNLTIGFDGYKKRPFHQSIVRLEHMSHFRNVLDTGSVRIPRSFPELLDFINDCLEFPDKDLDKRKFLVEKMCYRNDGQASKRLVDLIFQF